jgi:hypothetical protein
MIRRLVRMGPQGTGHHGVVLKVVRYWLPGLVVLAGVLAMAVGRSPEALEGGAAIVGAGASIWLINLLFRIGVTGDRERDEEDAARAYFDRHGRWPDDPAPPGPATPHRGLSHRGPARPRRPRG